MELVSSTEYRKHLGSVVHKILHAGKHGALVRHPSFRKYLGQSIDLCHSRLFRLFHHGPMQHLSD